MLVRMDSEHSPQSVGPLAHLLLVENHDNIPLLYGPILLPPLLVGHTMYLFLDGIHSWHAIYL